MILAPYTLLRCQQLESVGLVLSCLPSLQSLSNNLHIYTVQQQACTLPLLARERELVRPTGAAGRFLLSERECL